VNENFGFLNFFQKGAKSGDEFRGKFLYESDRVCYYSKTRPNEFWRVIFLLKVFSSDFCWLGWSFGVEDNRASVERLV